MVLIVENGTGLANANAYVSVAEVEAYAAAFDLQFNGSTAHKESAIIKATQWIDIDKRYKGSILVATQARSFPRLDLYDHEERLITGVPQLVKAACCEIAIFVSNGGSLISTPETAAIKRKRVKAGSVETETEYTSTSGLNNDFSQVPKADKMLSIFVLSSFSNSSGGIHKRVWV